MAYPLDGPISDMGLNSAEAAMLTPKAKVVTKQQILVLSDVARMNQGATEEEVTQLFDKRTGLTLNVVDLNSMVHAFNGLNGRRSRSPDAAAAVACCCTCTPCCSCTASVVVESRI
jgi:hypothetical protein